MRIVWAIAAKDMVDAITNKTTIAVILGVALLMLSGQALPLIARVSEVHRVVVFDAGESEWMPGLNRSPEVALVRVDSQHAMEELLGGSSDATLGLALPADFDRALDIGQPVELESFFAHWVGEADKADERAFFQARLAELTGRPVRIHTGGHAVYPGPDSDGQPFMAALSLVVAIITISTILVPYLMLEERENKTLDALLVSPARVSQVTAGKAIAGMVYGLAAAGVVFLFNRALVVHWEWAVLTALVGTSFAVALGLLLGSSFDNPQNLNLWMGVIVAVLIIPVMLRIMPAKLPALLDAIVPRIPSTALTRAFQLSFSGGVPPEDILSDLGYVAGWAALLLAGVVWIVRRSDR